MSVYFTAQKRLGWQ